MVLSIASFAMASAGLVVRVAMKEGPAKHVCIVAAFIFVLLFSGALVQQQWAERREIRKAADEIVRIIGNGRRTYEDVVAGLRSPNHQTTNGAMEMLLDEQRVGSDEAVITDDAGNPLRVRLYFVRTF
jgi:hypothetical protein